MIIVSNWTVQYIIRKFALQPLSFLKTSCFITRSYITPYYLCSWGRNNHAYSFHRESTPTVYWKIVNVFITWFMVWIIMVLGYFLQTSVYHCIDNSKNRRWLNVSSFYSTAIRSNSNTFLRFIHSQSFKVGTFLSLQFLYKI